MKKLLLSVLALTMLMGITSCAKEETPEGVPDLEEYVHAEIKTLGINCREKFVDIYFKIECTVSPLSKQCDYSIIAYEMPFDLPSDEIEFPEDAVYHIQITDKNKDGLADRVLINTVPASISVEIWRTWLPSYSQQGRYYKEEPKNYKWLSEEFVQELLSQGGYLIQNIVAFLHRGK